MPPGLVHGYMALSYDTEIIYIVLMYIIIMKVELSGMTIK